MYFSTLMLCFFFFKDTATTEIYPLSLHDALPIFCRFGSSFELMRSEPVGYSADTLRQALAYVRRSADMGGRSEEHTSELQSRQYLVCRLLLEKKKKHPSTTNASHSSYDSP